MPKNCFKIQSYSIVVERWCVSYSKRCSSAQVVDCATHLYDHNYDVKFALEYIFQDKIFFREVVGLRPALQPPNSSSSLEG